MGKVFKPRQCKNCGSSYIPTGPAQRYCPTCGPEIFKKKQRASIDKYRARNGVQVGIGSGNAQTGAQNHQWKGGIATYTKTKLTSLGDGNYYCEHCGKDLNDIVGDATRYALWNVHHKDGDQNNPDLSNLELLCRSCHALVHNVHNNFLGKV